MGINYGGWVTLENDNSVTIGEPARGVAYVNMSQYAACRIMQEINNLMHDLKDKKDGN